MKTNFKYSSDLKALKTKIEKGWSGPSSKRTVQDIVASKEKKK